MFRILVMIIFLNTYRFERFIYSVSNIISSVHVLAFLKKHKK